MRKLGRFGLVALLALFIGVANINAASALGGLSNEEKTAIKELAWQYYIRGAKIQYDVSRRDIYALPEDATSQSVLFSDCSGFTHAVYYNALGVEIPSDTYAINTYGKVFYNNPDHPDVRYYTEDYTQVANDASNILAGLQVGDLVSYYHLTSVFGHVLLVYDLEHDPATGEIVDAVFLHSTSDRKQTYSKLTQGLNWNDSLNSTTGINEGTVKLINFAKLLDYVQINRVQRFTVLRPAALDGKLYNKPNYGNPENSGCSYSPSTCTSSQESYGLTSDAALRVKYPGLEIEKTVDVFNGSVVEPGDTLTYNIKITNHSSEHWEPFVMKENIPTNLVYSKNQPNASELVFDVDAVGPGETRNISYSVVVKSDPSVVGQEIVSTGNVAGIASDTVKNRIGYNLSQSIKSRLKEGYNNLKGEYSGTELIDKIYAFAMDKNYNVKDLLLGALYNRDSDSNATKQINQNCSPYFKTTNVNALMDTYSSHSYHGITFNKNNNWSKMVLNNYYSSVNTSFNASCEPGSIYIRGWANWSGGKNGQNRSDREVLIYPETLQTGDVLIYADTGSKTSPDPVTNESGTYAFIYLDDGFYGVNSLANGTAKNFIKAENKVDTDNIWTIFGKDYYAILRPSLLASAPFDGGEIPEDDSDEPNAPNTGVITGEPNGTIIGRSALVISLMGIMSYIICYVIKREKAKIRFNKK